MSAWRVGVESAEKARVVHDEHGGAEPLTGPPGGPQKEAGRQGQPVQPKADDSSGALEAAFNRLTKWIPGEALTFYAAAVTAFAAKDSSRPSVALLIVFIGVTIALVLLGGFAATGEVPRKNLVSGALAGVAFLIWSVTVPFSGWQRWSFIHDNQAVVTILAAIAAALFCLTAEGINKRIARADKR